MKKGKVPIAVFSVFMANAGMCKEAGMFSSKTREGKAETAFVDPREKVNYGTIHNIDGKNCLPVCAFSASYNAFNFRTSGLHAVYRT